MIPLATTTIEIRGRRGPFTTEYDPDAEGYDNLPPVETIAVAVRACISQPAFKRNSGNVAEVDTYTCSCDMTTDLGLGTVDFEPARDDIVHDNSTGREYLITAVVPSVTDSFGLQHFKLYLRQEQGLSGGNTDAVA